MVRKEVEVQFPHGLHLRPAARLVRLAQRFHATISLRTGTHRADLRSLLSIVSLCAIMGTTLVLEVAGDDEESAAQAVERFFESADDDGPENPGKPLVDRDDPSR